MGLGKLEDIVHRLGPWLDNDDGVFFHRPQAPIAKPYDRTDYIINLCKGKRVLHFGFTDSPFMQERIKNGEILHLKIKKVSRELWGTDIDAKSLRKYVKITGDKNVMSLDISKPLKNPRKYKKNFDLLIFGEVLEHVLNPGITLHNLAKICRINRAKLLVTTPNAFNVAGFMAAWRGNEIVHPEHYYYYSPVTLNRLLIDTGFTNIRMSLYASDATKDTEGITAPGLLALCEAK